MYETDYEVLVNSLIPPQALSLCASSIQMCFGTKQRYLYYARAVSAVKKWEKWLLL